MTLRDLIDALADLADDLGEDTEVRLAQQPRWAFEYSIGNVVGLEAVTEDDIDEDDEDRPDAPRPAIVYICEGQQLGYLPGEASRALGWSGR